MREIATSTTCTSRRSSATAGVTCVDAPRDPRCASKPLFPFFATPPRLGSRHAPHLRPSPRDRSNPRPRIPRAKSRLTRRRPRTAAFATPCAARHDDRLSPVSRHSCLDNSGAAAGTGGTWGHASENLWIGNSGVFRADFEAIPTTACPVRLQVGTVTSAPRRRARNAPITETASVAQQTATTTRRGRVACAADVGERAR